MRLQLVLAFSSLATVWLEPGFAHAEPADPLLLAERAYNDVAFEAQRNEATRALQAGRNGRERLAHIYRLLGIAQAALEAPEEAKQTFMKLLAIDPDVALEHVLSPRLRTPYMEARGYWDVTSSRLGVQAAVAPGALDLHVTVTDPLLMVALVRVRALGKRPSIVAEAAPAHPLVIARRRLQPHAGVPFQIELLDSYANVLVVKELPPLAPGGPDRRAQSAPSRDTPRAQEPSESFPVLPAVLGGAALLAVGVGAYAHVLRENKAGEWNGAACERSGLGTREQQCGTIDDQRRTAQDTATVAYAVGGGLLVAGLVTYLTSTGDARPGEQSGQLSCSGGPSAVGLSCATVW